VIPYTSSNPVIDARMLAVPRRMVTRESYPLAWMT
jgi:hypothetical protein